MAWKDDWRFRDCPWCGVKDVAMTTHAHFEVPSARGTRFFTTVGCPRCGGAVTIEHRQANVHTISPVNVYPSDPQSSDVAHLPEDVESYYTDARRVLDAGVPDAAAVQMRRTLEAAAAHFNIDNGPLFRRIEGLIEQGLITRNFGGVLHHVRAIGNIGAHASDDRVDDATAKRVLSFTTQVLRNLFEVPAELRAAVGEPENEPPAADT